MNLTDKKYSPFLLVKEMLETIEVVKNFNPRVVADFAAQAKLKKGLFLTGEGSSRIFPAKNTIYNAQKQSSAPTVLTEGSIQAREYALNDFALFGASNSGQTKEIILLIEQLKAAGHDSLFGLTANKATKLGEVAHKTHILSCGKEDAVAATKSVVEQALFYHSLLNACRNKPTAGLAQLATDIETTLTSTISEEICDTIASAPMIYFAGRNTGVAEELRLKTNEITRKKSDYLEGTYALHGIEEVMRAGEVIIWVDPYESEWKSIQSCLIDGAGVSVVAISTKETAFPTIVVPENTEYQTYIELAAGWNILVEVGIKLGINLDKPERARKVGNAW